MPEKLLSRISCPEDLRALDISSLPGLANELRNFIIEVVATKEGHLGASLGVVELTIALHYVFQTPNDLLVWDVGHQAYGHKILTGRKNKFITNRQLHGISGFPRRAESIYDTFGTGHSSTAISAALGMAIASHLKGEKKHHIAIVGDASIASGMAFEGLNHAAVANMNLLIVLNDNAIGIDPSVGGLNQHLTALKKATIEKYNNLFEALKISYTGPVDGHNLAALIDSLELIKNHKGPQILHVVTTKGKGLLQAENDQITYHAPGKFNKDTGEIIPGTNKSIPPKFQDVFGHTLVELAKKNRQIIGITPAMPTGCSLSYMMQVFPDRAFDVGIAEQHAVTLAAGMAAQGFIVFCNIYSTFLQRAYDQVIHDVALQELPVVFCLDRAGLVGEDGATHHGVFDIAFLRCIPNIIIYAPIDEIELRNILYTAQRGLNKPIAIRYPRGRGVTLDWQQPFKPIEIGQAVLRSKGKEVAILSTGFIGTEVTTALTNLPINTVAHYHFGFIKPLDENTLHEIFKTYKIIFTIEEGVIIGGFGSAISAFASINKYANEITSLGIPDTFISHGTIEELRDICGLSAKKILERLQQVI